MDPVHGNTIFTKHPRRRSLTDYLDLEDRADRDRLYSRVYRVDRAKSSFPRDQAERETSYLDTAPKHPSIAATTRMPVSSFFPLAQAAV